MKLNKVVHLYLKQLWNYTLKIVKKYLEIDQKPWKIMEISWNFISPESGNPVNTLLELDMCNGLRSKTKKLHSPTLKSDITVLVLFQNARDLRNHLKTHEAPDGKPFVCKSCSKRFVCERYARICEKSHAGDMPFICMSCGKCAPRNLHLPKMYLEVN